LGGVFAEVGGDGAVVLAEAAVAEAGEAAVAELGDGEREAVVARFLRRVVRGPERQGADGRVEGDAARGALVWAAGVGEEVGRARRDARVVEAVDLRDEGRGESVEAALVLLD